ncbi:MAG: hypothetical protein ACREVY_10445 [Gammaproteobacteria bacterium]
MNELKPCRDLYSGMNMNELKPCRDLYIRVRAAFVAQDSSLGEWCRKNGIERQTATHCLIGVWNGPKGRKIRARIIEGAGIAEGRVSPGAE